MCGGDYADTRFGVVAREFCPACAETPALVAAWHFRAVEASGLYDLSYV